MVTCTSYGKDKVSVRNSTGWCIVGKLKRDEPSYLIVEVDEVIFAGVVLRTEESTTYVLPKRGW